MTGSPHRQVTVAVIAKEPVPGRVKTRLCPPCTPTQAADIAMAALQDTLDAVAGVEAARRVVVLEGSPGPWIPPQFEVVAQRGDTLDERLGAAVADVGGPLVVIGMDTPQVTSTLIDEVVATLCSRDTDAVLGLAGDGGYWVIGLWDTRPDALLGVPMSTATTGAEQLRRLTGLGLRTVVVGALDDVDTFDEAVRVGRQSPDGRFARAVERVSHAVTAAHVQELSARG